MLLLVCLPASLPLLGWFVFTVPMFCVLCFVCGVCVCVCYFVLFVGSSVCLFDCVVACLPACLPACSLACLLACLCVLCSLDKWQASLHEVVDAPPAFFIALPDMSLEHGKGGRRGSARFWVGGLIFLCSIMVGCLVLLVGEVDRSQCASHRVGPLAQPWQR